MRRKKDIIEKRSNIVALSLTLLFVVLTVRLYFVQMVKGEKYSEYANKQQTFSIETSAPRGIIFDRNGKRLTNTDKEKVAYILLDNIKNNEQKISELKEALNYTDSKMKEFLDSSERIKEIILSENNIDIDKVSNIKDVIIIDREERNNKENILSHVIGRVNQGENKGKSGLEEIYDTHLKADLSYGKKNIFIDAKRRIVPSMDITFDKNNIKGIANSLKLTVDYDIQKQVEKILDKKKKKGSVIVTEVETGDILAMASRPNINLRQIAEDLDKTDGRFYNKSLMPYPPGSIFKIPVLLAGLKSGEISLDDRIYCKGYEEVSGRITRCNKKDGHGDISILEGFYQSCNSTFIQIGKKISGKSIIDMAKTLGFGEEVKIGLKEKWKGNLPKGNDLLGAAIGNISLGQGEIEATPLQVNNMTMIIANNGIKKDLKIVDSLVNIEGVHGKRIEREKDERVIPSYMAEKVKLGLENVVEKGTARNIDIKNAGGGGGKTGSAQTGKNNESLAHAWFTGYFPKDSPKYAITVFIENGDSGSTVAAPIFEEIVKEIYKRNNK